MNIILQCRGLDLSWGWRDFVEAQFQTLNPSTAINRARIIIERGSRKTSVFRVAAFLDVPGPLFKAEARDYTLQAALRKVIDSLQKQIRSRKERRKAKRKTNLSLNVPTEIGHPSPGR